MYTDEIAGLWPDEVEAFLESPVWASALRQGLSWQQAMTEPEALKEAAERLSPYGRVMLKLLVRHGGLSAVEEDRLLKAGMTEGKLSGLEAKAGIRELQSAGLLLAVAKLWGDRLVFAPKDSYPQLALLLLPPEGKPSPIPFDGHLELLRPVCRPLGRQLLSAFAELARSGTGLTGKGLLPKKHIQKLVSVTNLSERTLQGLGAKPSAEGRQYPLPVALLLHAGLQFGLLCRTGKALEWNESRLADWLELHVEVREASLYEWICDVLLGNKAEAALTAALIGSLQPGEWFAIDDIRRWILCGMGGSCAWSGDSDSAGLTDKMEAWLQLMNECGWAELGEAGGLQLFRWTRPVSRPMHSADGDGQDGAAGDGFVPPPEQGLVQANGDIIVYPDCRFTVRWELEAAAELVSDDSVTLYRMTAESVRRAVGSGRSGENLAELLSYISGRKPLPSELLDWLRQTVRHASRIQLREAAVLCCADEQTADELEAYPLLRPYLGERVGGRHFLVSGNDLEPLRARLKEAGLPLLSAANQSSEAGGSAGAPVVSLSGEQAEPRGSRLRLPSDPRGGPEMLEHPGPLSGHKLVRAPRGEKRTPLLPETAEVPLMWLKQLRAYHDSTRKEMLERAVAWQTPVQIRMERGLRAFVPEKLETAPDGWAVVGLLREEESVQSVRLTPDMWNEMKLLVPES
ncbi:helicase-associated domain-containing protein [Paenibacillus thailandensis]|uniref:Helicase-associated domain-containing protein n=1 Tax=Paenibacillus thailandensis TaxID=393250 RepID=A0ABW5QX23_9BACL